MIYRSSACPNQTKEVKLRLKKYYPEKKKIIYTKNTKQDS